MARIGDNGLQIDKKILVNVKHFGIGCLFGIRFKLIELYSDFSLFVGKILCVRI